MFHTQNLQQSKYMKQKDKIFFTIEDVVIKIKQEKLYIIGICGIPGAGKSTISELLKQSIPNSIIIPMDGFHLYRKDLDEQGIRRRGAPFTFDLKKFKSKLLQLKSAQKSQQSQQSKFPIYFPSFDHSLKDPKQNDIVITPSIQHIIIQGLYIFDKSLGLLNQIFWDLKLFIDEYEQACLPRVIKRCVQKGIQDTYQKAVQRATKSDMVNGKYVVENSDYSGVYYIKNG